MKLKSIKISKKNRLKFILHYISFIYTILQNLNLAKESKCFVRFNVYIYYNLHELCWYVGSTRVQVLTTTLLSFYNKYKLRRSEICWQQTVSVSLLWIKMVIWMWKVISKSLLPQIFNSSYVTDRTCRKFGSCFWDISTDFGSILFIFAQISGCIFIMIQISGHIKKFPTEFGGKIRFHSILSTRQKDLG